MNLKWARSCTLTITCRHLTIHGRGPINRPHRHYVKRPHPHLRAYTGRFFGEIGLGSRRRSITHGLFSIGLPSASKGICPKKPTSGRPQGSPPRVNPPPALTKIRCDSSDPRIFVRAGGVRVSGWDPCGRPDNYPLLQGERAEASTGASGAKRMPATNQRKRSQPSHSVCQPGGPSQARRRNPPS